MRNLKITQVIGKPVVNRQKDYLGYVEDLLMDAERSRIEYARLALERDGHRGRTLDVPWSAVDGPAPDGSMVLDMASGGAAH